MGGRCYYHPAPLTKSRDIVTCNNGESAGVISTPQHPPPNVGEEMLAPPTQLRFHGATHEERLCIVKVRQISFSTGYIFQYMIRVPPYAQSFVHWTDTMQEIIGHLHYYPLIEKVVKEYCSHGQAHLIPSPLILPILASLSHLPSLCGLLEDSSPNEAEIGSLAARILRSTATPVTITSSLSVEGFCSALTEPSLRLEMLGVMYSIAARACSAGLSRDDDGHGDFIQTMFRASLDCRRIAKDIAPLNDALLWLTYETVILSSCVLGHSSKCLCRFSGHILIFLDEIVWDRLGDLSSMKTPLGHICGILTSCLLLKPMSSRSAFTEKLSLSRTLLSFLLR
jgi:hypothetical protein